VEWDRIVAVNQAGAAFASVPGQGQEEYKVVGGGENVFPSEYSVGGWFKWAGAYNGWATMFRLTINDKPIN
jgi:hypothetical protein